MNTCGHNCEKLRGWSCVACDETPKTKPVTNVRTIPEIIPERDKIERPWRSH